MKSTLLKTLLLCCTVALLSACGGGGGGGGGGSDSPDGGNDGGNDGGGNDSPDGGNDGGDSNDPPLPAPADTPELTVTVSEGSKSVQFSWNTIDDATHYQLVLNPDGVSGFSQLGSDLDSATTSTTIDIGPHQFDRINGRYILEACNSVSCTPSNEVTLTDFIVSDIIYTKSTNTEDSDWYGHSVAISGDGYTLAVGATGEDSETEIDVDNNNAENSGAVYVYLLREGSWEFDSYLKSPTPHAEDEFGHAIALNENGKTLAISANAEDNGGSVYVFARGSSTWIQQGLLNPATLEAGDNFGVSLAISSEGDTLVIGADGEDSEAGADATDNNASGSGAAYVFSRDGEDVWSQQAMLKASNAEADDGFGAAVTISTQGTRLAVGAPGEDSDATGINGEKTSNLAAESGAVYIFSLNEDAWTEEDYLKASNTDAGDSFGSALSMNGIGSLLAVGAPLEDSSATGVDGNGDDSVIGSGAAYVFFLGDDGWSQQAYIKANNTQADAMFGAALSMNQIGDLLAIGAPSESALATGVNAVGEDNTDAPASGAVYLFSRSVLTWGQASYIKATNAGAGDLFGTYVNMSHGGENMVVGAPGEASSATGVEPLEQDDNSTEESGAAYVF